MTYVRNESVTCRQEEDGNVIAFNSATGAGFLLNSTSKLLLDLCDGTHDLDSVLSLLRGQYGDTVPADLDQIIEAHLSLLQKATLVDLKTA